MRPDDRSRADAPRPGGAIVVLGANGWVGRHVLAAARSRGRAVGVARRPVPGSGLTALSDAAGLASLVRREGAHTVISCVGLTTGPAADLEEANVRFPLSVAETCRQLSVRLVHLGSAAEYGSQDSLGLVSETVTPSPATPYGISKLAGTTALAALRDDNLDVTVARLFNLVGPRQPATTPLGEFARAVRALPRAGGVVNVRDSGLARDYLGCAVASDLVVRIAHAADAPAVINVCSGRALTFRELIVAMGEYRGVEVRVVDTAPGRSGFSKVVGDPTLLQRTVGAIPLESVPDLAGQAMQVTD